MNFLHITSMIQLIIQVIVLTDPDKILQRLQDALSENLKLPESFTNKQAIISDHQELSHLTYRLQAIKNKVDFLIFDAGD